jgi:hypothetical protein
MAFKDAKRCKAHSKRTGEPCKNPAVIGFDVCRMHGAHGPGSKKPGRQPGCEKPEGSGGPAWRNTNALKHGAYSSRLPPDETPFYEALLAEYMEDVPNPTATDSHGLQRLAVIETKWQTAVSEGAPPDALERLGRMLHVQLKELRLTREARGAPAAVGTSPAEVVADLLARVRRSQMETSQAVAPAPDEAAAEDEAIEVT